MWIRFLKGLMALFSSQAILMAGNLIMVPLYLTHWSVLTYGEWLAMISLVSYLTNLQMGMNGAVINKLTQAYTRDDLSDYRSVQQSALFIFAILALGASVLLGLTAYFFPIYSWIGISNTSPEIAKWVIWLLGLQFLWAMPIGVILNAYRTTGNLAKTQWLANIQQIMTMGVTAVILISGGGMCMIASSQLLPMAVIFLYVLWNLRQDFPALLPGFREIKLSAIKELLSPSLDFAKLTVANAISIQGATILVSNRLGGLAVALFVTSRTLINLVRQILSSFNYAIWPNLTSLEAQGRQARLRELHRILVIGSGVLCTSIGGALWFEGDAIMSFWTRGKLVPDPTLLRLLVIYLTLQVPWQASAIFSVATNKFKKYAWLYLFSAVLGIGIAIVLIKTMGICAIPIGLMLGEIFMCSHFVIKDTCKMLGESYGPFALRVWTGLGIVFLTALSAGRIGQFIIRGPYIIDIMGIFVFIIAATITMAWFTWLKAEDRTYFAGKLRLILSYK